MIYRKNSASQSGNVFFALFGAVALVGAVGAASMTVLKGPVRTMSEVTKRTLVENEMLGSSKIILGSSGTDQGYTDGSCDGDAYIEPWPYETVADDAECINSPTGGGCLPVGLGAAAKDPWGRRYGYCVWDHGAETLQPDCESPASSGTSKRLGGTDSDLFPVIAIISAGADGVFQSTCLSAVDADAAGNNNLTLDANESLYTRPSGSDDIAQVHIYRTVGDFLMSSGAGGGGMWTPKDASTATIAKDLEVRNAADTDTAFSLDRTTGVSEFFAIKTDNIYARTVPDTGSDPYEDVGLITLNSPLRMYTTAVSGQTYDPPVGGGGAVSGGGGGATELNDLTDVNTAGVVSTNVLAWNGTNWVPTAAGGADTLASLSCDATNNIAKWNNVGGVWECQPDAGAGGGSLWSDDGPEGPAEIYYSGGNVGIGTNNPAYALEIGNNGWFSLVNGGIRANSTSTSGQPTLFRAGNSAGHSLEVRYTEDAISSIPADVWHFRAGGSTHDIAFSEYDNQPLLFLKFGGTDAVGIGTNTPAETLDVSGNVNYSGYMTNVSDRRLKENIAPLDGQDMLNRLLQVEGVSYIKKAMPENGTEYGVIAQDLEELFPNLVMTHNDEQGTKSVNYLGLIAPLIEAIKIQQKEIEALKAKIEAQAE